MSPVCLKNIMKKEELLNIAQSTKLNKEFEIIEIVEHKENHFTIYIESLSGITIDDCTSVLKQILQKLPEETNVEITVSSAGIDKPLRAPIQFIKHIGKKVEVKTRDGKKYTGILHQYTPKSTTIIVENKNEKREVVMLNEFIQQVKIVIF